jgi:Domain of unknown function (DUF4190)
MSAQPTQPRWSAPPAPSSAEPGHWVTPPPLDDGSDVWSDDLYASAGDAGYGSTAGYAQYNGYSTSPASFRAPGAYPYYSNFDQAAPQSLPPYWPQVGGQRPTDGYAITSLVFGIIGGWILGLAFGIAALRRINRGVRDGRGLALTGIWLSVAWLVVLLVVTARYVS